MNLNEIQILCTMLAYMAIVIGIGIAFAKRANKNSENYFLGGRSLGPWIAAMSAEASDMSGWLLMGLPGVAYWFGLADAAWTAIGLAVGTYLNWLITAKRLRRYSEKCNNSITIPDFFSNRFHESKKIIMTISALFILIFFSVYASSCLVTCGKLFSTLFGLPYIYMLIIGAIFVLVYTFLGGFLAESASDFMQAIVMIGAIIVVFVLGVGSAGGIENVIDNARQLPGFLEFFQIGNPTVAADGTVTYGAAGSYGFLTVLSTLSWGLGYFGMPQVLLRFMAIRNERELGKSRRIATVWCVISLFAAVCIGIVGKELITTGITSSSEAESIFILLSTKLLPPILAGLIMAGILAATISSSDSYLLIAASAVSKNIFQGIIHKRATDKQVMLVSRITLFVITLIAIIIALDEKSVIFTLVSFAWAGFGATFGPLMIFSLFWKRINAAGAIAGILSGGISVFVWKLCIKPMGGIFGIYELLPAFLISCVAIVVVSLLTAKPSQEIQDEFDEVRLGNKA